MCPQFLLRSDPESSNMVTDCVISAVRVIEAWDSLEYRQQYRSNIDRKKNTEELKEIKTDHQNRRLEVIAAFQILKDWLVKEQRHSVVVGTSSLGFPNCAMRLDILESEKKLEDLVGNSIHHLCVRWKAWQFLKKRAIEGWTVVVLCHLCFEDTCDIQLQNAHQRMLERIRQQANEDKSKAQTSIDIHLADCTAWKWFEVIAPVSLDGVMYDKARCKYQLDIVRNILESKPETDEAMETEKEAKTARKTERKAKRARKTEREAKREAKRENIISIESTICRKRLREAEPEMEQTKVRGRAAKGARARDWRESSKYRKGKILG